jgi:hypothetical protein
MSRCLIPLKNIHQHHLLVTSSIKFTVHWSFSCFKHGYHTHQFSITCCGLDTECSAECLPGTKFYIPGTSIGRNIGTSMKDAESPSFGVPQQIYTHAPLVAWQTSRQFSTSCQVFCSITGETVSWAASHLATQFIHMLHLRLVHQVLYVAPQKKNVKGSNLVTREAMRLVPLSQSICLWTADQERLSLGWYNVERQPYRYHIQISRGFIFQPDWALYITQTSESLSWSAVCRQRDWERGSYRMASQVTRFDPFRFLSKRVHNELGVPNNGTKCGWTAPLNNCILWDCYTSDATEYLARGGVSSWHFSGHQRHICGDLLRNITTWKLPTSFSKVCMFLSILIYET